MKNTQGTIDKKATKERERKTRGCALFYPNNNVGVGVNNYESKL